jgi:small-conductance mechanosensitive channel
MGGRAGFVVLGALGLALVPLFASMTVGFSTVFWRRLHVGDFVSFDGRQGRVASINLLEVRVHDGEGSELRIPHLLTLVRPLRVLGPYPLATFEVVVDPKASQDRVRKVMVASGASKHGEPRVRLLFIDQDGAHYEIVAKRALDEEDPATAITRALADAGIDLGRSRA